MLDTGDLVRIRFQDSARNNKPAGCVPGLDYSNGQRMVLTLYDVAPD